MSQFWYTLTNPLCEELLKEEMNLYYPKFKLSFSSPQFITFKSEDTTVIKDLKFAHDWGNCINVKNPHEIKDYLELPLTDIKNHKEEYYLKTKNNFWFLKSTKRNFLFPHLGQSFVHPELNVPSRAYFKILEAVFVTKTDLSACSNVLDLGASPGGASYYFLENNLKVLGIDPGMMDQICLEHKNFRHLQMSIQHVGRNELNSPYDIVACDINLPGSDVFPHLMNIIEHLKPKYLFWTIKINKPREILKLDEFRRVLLTFYQNVHFISLPGHKKETLLFCR
jgi:hypothetical protein